jgi:hypothetical protein
MTTVAQYREAVSANRRREYCLLPVLVVFLYGLPLGFVALLKPYADSSIEASAQWVVRHGISHWLTVLIGLAVVLPLGLLLAVPAVAVLRFRDRLTRRDRRLFCPHCDARLCYLAVVTGNCHRCGEQALDVPGRDPAAAVAGEIQGPDHPLLTVEEFNAAVRNRLKCGDPEHRDPRLKCPRCRADLMGRSFNVVATRKCLRCEAPVLEDPEDTPPTGDPHAEQRRPSLAGFRAAHRAYGRWSLFLGLSVCLGFLVPMVFVVGPWGKQLEQLLGEVGVAVLAFAVLILGLCLVLGVVSLADRCVRQKLQMGCPYCGRLLYHPTGIVIATRRCWHCGRHALAEEDTILSPVSAANES